MLQLTRKNGMVTTVCQQLCEQHWNQYGVSCCWGALDIHGSWLRDAYLVRTLRSSLYIRISSLPTEETPSHVSSFLCSLIGWVCMYVYIYVYTNVHTHIHESTRAYIPTYRHTYIHAYIILYVHTYTCIHFAMSAMSKCSRINLYMFIPVGWCVDYSCRMVYLKALSI